MNNELESIRKIFPIVSESLSDTACLAKWHHTTIYLQTGETHSCYHPPPHNIPLVELESNPSALHNTFEKKLQRKKMLEGEKPSGCSYCWNIEELGENYVSDRHIKTSSIYTKERLDEILDNDWDFNINPEYIEISFSNECNFKCGYCHPKASSRYWQEINKFGPYSMSTDHRQDIDWFKLYHREEENPYVDAWWKWWPEVSKTLTILRITGGEPLLHKSTWQLFERLRNEPKPNIQIELNSNLGVKHDLVRKLTDSVKELRSKNKIKSFKLYTSIDTWSERAEYTRTGLNLELWEENLDYYLSNTGWPVTFMITFNLFTVTSFDQLLGKILEWRKKYNNLSNETQWQRIRFDTPHLKEPNIFDMNILPKQNYLLYMENHLDYIKQNLDDNDRTKFTSLEYEKFKRVVDYMKNNSYDESKLKESRINFHNWFSEYDKRRGTNIREIFPEMIDFLNLCKNLAN